MQANDTLVANAGETEVHPEHENWALAFFHTGCCPQLPGQNHNPRSRLPMNASASPYGTATAPADRADRLQLVAELRERLAGAERELSNPKLFTVTRRCLAERIARLKADVAELCCQLGEPLEGRAAL